METTTRVCSKDHLFAEPIPPCTREATQELTVTITRGRSKGATATAHVCGSCAFMLRLHSSLSVAE